MIFSEAAILLVSSSPLSRYNIHRHKINTLKKIKILVIVQKPYYEDECIEQERLGNSWSPINCTLHLRQDVLCSGNAPLLLSLFHCNI